MKNSAEIQFIFDNISDESKVDEIIQCIQENNINPDKIFRFGNNVFFEAACDGNLKLLQRLCQNHLVDVNSKTHDGMPLLALLAQVYEPKHDPIIDFLLNETAIDVNATNRLGYTGGAWAERTNKISLMLKLALKEPIDSPVNIMYHTKMTCLRFGLKNPADGNMQLNCKKLPADYQTVEPEGYQVRATIPSLTDSFNQFTHEKAIFGALSSVDRTIYRNVNSCLQNHSLHNKGYSDPQTSGCTQLLDSYKKGEMIAIHGEAKDHAASVVMVDNTLYRCNRGLEKHPEYSITQYRINNPEELNTQVIQSFLTTINPGEQLRLQEQDGINGKEQYSGNCIVASPKKAIHAMIYAQVRKHYPPDADHKKIARDLYKKWSAWDRTYQIQLLLSSCKEAPEVLTALLKNILYDTARFSTHHIELAKAIRERLGLAVKIEIDNLFMNFLEKESLKHQLKTPDSTFDEGWKKYVDLFNKIDMRQYATVPEEAQILYATAAGNLKQLKQLLEDSYENVLLTLPSQRELTALHLAVMWNREDCLETLIQHHPELIDKTDRNHFTPLHMAVYSGKPKLVEILIKNGANRLLNAGKQKQLSVDFLLENISNRLIAEDIKQALSAPLHKTTNKFK